MMTMTIGLGLGLGLAFGCMSPVDRILKSVCVLVGCSARGRLRHGSGQLVDDTQRNYRFAALSVRLPGADPLPRHADAARRGTRPARFHRLQPSLPGRRPARPAQVRLVVNSHRPTRRAAPQLDGVRTGA